MTPAPHALHGKPYGERPGAQIDLAGPTQWWPCAGCPRRHQRRGRSRSSVIERQRDVSIAQECEDVLGALPDRRALHDCQRDLDCHGHHDGHFEVERHAIPVRNSLENGLADARFDIIKEAETNRKVREQKKNKDEKQFL